jgi:flavin-dependent dehydrogenase
MAKKLNNCTPICWRRDLDYWMIQRAKAKGADIWECIRVVNLRHNRKHFWVEIEKDKRKENLAANFLIGADGATSIVRHFLFLGACWSTRVNAK